MFSLALLLQITLASSTQAQLGTFAAPSDGVVYTNNPICRKKACINPLTPGLSDLPRLENLVWQCPQSGDVGRYVRFCKSALYYDPALPSPMNKSMTLDRLVDAQDAAASEMFFYHLSGLGYDGWDYSKPSDIEDPCVRAIYDMVCYTYFPKSMAGCKAGSQTPYSRPCRNSCHTYLNACQVECCDDSARCVFETSTDMGGGVVNKETGYVDADGPSAICTGGSGNSAGSRLLAPFALVFLLLGAPLVTGSAEAQGSTASPRRSFLSMVPNSQVLLLVMMIVSCVSMQGCSLVIPNHNVAAWRKMSNYLMKYEYVPAGQFATAATLNSCSAGAAGREVCSGRGQCKPWFRLPLKVVDPKDADDTETISFCECDAEWADPECRTERKSQLKAFFLSLFGGFLGLDLFYLGFKIWGICKLFTLGGFGFWWLFDIVRVGCAPPYAQDFRVNHDLPHWVFMTVLLVLFSTAGLLYSLESYFAYRKQKRNLLQKLSQGDEETHLDRTEGAQGAARNRTSRYYDIWTGLPSQDAKGYGATMR